MQLCVLYGCIITKNDIEEYVRRGCGICESMKMRRPPFKAITDKTAAPVGKRWTFDSLCLRTPTAEFKSLYITRFVNVIENMKGVMVSLTSLFMCGPVK